MGQNYLLLQQQQIKKIETEGRRPSLLLHACCAPCSSAVLEYLSSIFDISIYYYNPNIHPEAEYSRRLEELETFLETTNRKLVFKNQTKLIHAEYHTEDFFAATNVRNEPELQTEPERGERCRRCYYFRMKKAYQYATEHGFDYFTTTLSISPYKDAQKINTIGQQLEQENPTGTTYLYADFKKKNGFLRSLQLSDEYGLYRQDYCGCIFSEQNRNISRQ